MPRGCLPNRRSAAGFACRTAPRAESTSAASGCPSSRERIWVSASCSGATPLPVGARRAELAGTSSAIVREGGDEPLGLPGQVAEGARTPPGVAEQKRGHEQHPVGARALVVGEHVHDLELGRGSEPLARRLAQALDRGRRERGFAGSVQGQPRRFHAVAVPYGCPEAGAMRWSGPRTALYGIPVVFDLVWRAPGAASRRRKPSRRRLQALEHLTVRSRPDALARAYELGPQSWTSRSGARHPELRPRMVLEVDTKDRGRPGSSAVAVSIRKTRRGRPHECHAVHF